MQHENRDLVVDELKRDIEHLSTLEPGSKEHTAVTDNIVKLYEIDMAIVEHERAYREKCEREVIEERELELKDKQIENQRMSTYIENGVKLGTFLLGAGFTTYWQKSEFKFNSEGIISSPQVKSMVSKFFSLVK